MKDSQVVGTDAPGRHTVQPKPPIFLLMRFYSVYNHGLILKEKMAL